MLSRMMIIAVLMASGVLYAGCSEASADESSNAAMQACGDYCSVTSKTPTVKTFTVTAGDDGKWKNPLYGLSHVDLFHMNKVMTYRRGAEEISVISGAVEMGVTGEMSIESYREFFRCGKYDTEEDCEVGTSSVIKLISEDNDSVDSGVDYFLEEISVTVMQW